MARLQDTEAEFGTFLSLVEHYVLTSERIKIIRGMVSRGVENFELIRMQDIDLKQGISERVMGIGDIIIRGQDPSSPEVVLRNISKPEEVYETLRRAWLDAQFGRASPPEADDARNP